jgi:hypothetical protein
VHSNSFRGSQSTSIAFNVLLGFLTSIFLSRSLPRVVRLIHLNPGLRPQVKNMSMPAVSDLKSRIHISSQLL